MKNTRYYAAHLFSRVLRQEQSLNDVLVDFPEAISDADRSLIKEMCFGACRYYHRLNAISAQVLNKPLKKDDSDIHTLLIIGLYQLLYMRIPSHAAVNETVKATQYFSKSWARNLCNAVFRQFLRSQNEITALIDQDKSIAFSHPEWLFEAIQTAWPDKWEALLNHNNSHPPMHFRINRQMTSRDNYLTLLDSFDIKAYPSQISPDGFRLEKPIAVTQLPGFEKGYLSVQDVSAQLAAPLLDLQPQFKVLDACAAPGGKTCHILEIEPDLANLSAIDIDEKRLEKVKENLQRLHLQAKLICADVGNTDLWWDGELYDRILLDTPCSGSGIIRRHPDIKLLRSREDVTKLAEQQQALLTKLWPLLKPGGILLYVTCSILPVENWLVIKHFLKNHQDAQEIKIKEEWGVDVELGRQLLPEQNEGDGFYYCCLKKRP